MLHQCKHIHVERFPESLSVIRFLPIPRPLLHSRFLSVPPETLKRTQLSVLFAILALTCQSTPNPPQEWPSGGLFYSASQAALGEDVWIHTDIDTVASLGLQSVWLEKAGLQGSLEAAWGRRGDALRVAQAVRNRCIVAAIILTPTDSWDSVSMKITRPR